MNHGHSHAHGGSDHRGRLAIALGLDLGGADRRGDRRLDHRQPRVARRRRAHAHRRGWTGDRADRGDAGPTAADRQTHLGLSSGRRCWPPRCRRRSCWRSASSCWSRASAGWSHPPEVASGMVVFGAVGLVANVISLLVLAGGRRRPQPAGRVPRGGQRRARLGRGDRRRGGDRDDRLLRADAVVSILIAVLIVPRTMVLLRETSACCWRDPTRAGPGPGARAPAGAGPRPRGARPARHPGGQPTAGAHRARRGRRRLLPRRPPAPACWTTCRPASPSTSRSASNTRHSSWSRRGTATTSTRRTPDPRQQLGAPHRAPDRGRRVIRADRAVCQRSGLAAILDATVGTR